MASTKFQNRWTKSAVLLGSALSLGLVASVSWQVQPASAQTAATSDQQEQAASASQQKPAILKPVVVQKPAQKPAAGPTVASASPASTDAAAAGSSSASAATPAARPKVRRSSDKGIKGPYYVDFRSRTAASYGHAFMWFGKSSEKKVDVAGLHPAGDETAFVLGHLIPVPAETGASYGDLDEQYLTASYRVYLSEPDAKRVFAYIRNLQKTTKFWNETTSSCTTFMGQVASFMGLKTPFYLKVPEDYVNSLRDLNDGRQTAQLAPESSTPSLFSSQ